MKLATYLHNRRLMLSLAVLAGAVFLIFLGTVIESKITDSAEQKARLYQTAVQTQDDNQFNYSIDTKQGNIFGQVSVRAVDLVKFPEMKKEFPRVKKTQERYTQHTRTVCETKYRTVTKFRTVPDGDGGYTSETYTEEIPYEECHQETYYSWDVVDRWELEAKEVEMAGRKYPIGLFALGNRDIDARDVVEGATGKYVMVEADRWIDIDFFDSASEGDVRYSYEVLELPKSGTVFLNVREAVKPVYGNKIVLHGEKPQEMVEGAKKSAQTQSTIFTVFWTILVLGELIGLGYVVWTQEY